MENTLILLGKKQWNYYVFMNTIHHVSHDNDILNNKIDVTIGFKTSSYIREQIKELCDSLLINNLEFKVTSIEIDSDTITIEAFRPHTEGA